MKRHINRSHEGGKERSHICAICDTNFQSQPDLRNHTIKNHEKEKKFLCNRCEKWFTGKPYFTRHMENVHEGIKRFKCDSCDSAYSQSGELKRHKAQMHDGQNFSCDQCQKKIPCQIQFNLNSYDSFQNHSSNC